MVLSEHSMSLIYFIPPSRMNVIVASGLYIDDWTQTRLAASLPIYMYKHYFLAYTELIPMYKWFDFFTFRLLSHLPHGSAVV